MSEYYVTHSKYKSNDRKSWENALTFVPESTLKKSINGTYNYYHNGKLVWSEVGSIEMFNDFSDGTVWELDYDDIKNAYPLYSKYSNDCQRMARMEYGY